MQTHRLILRDVAAAGKDHLSARFEAPAGFDFEAGQWGNLMVPGEGEASPRALSFATAPAERPALELCVRRTRNSDTIRCLESSPAGTGFDLQGPFGAFRWQAAHPGPVLFVASCTGIVPVRAMLRAAGPPGPAPGMGQILQGVLADEEPPYRDEWTAWRDAGFRVEEVRAEPGDEHAAQTWKSLTDAAWQHLRHRPEEDWRVYLAGHGAWIRPLRQRLRDELGWPRSSIKAETFWP